MKGSNSAPRARDCARALWSTARVTSTSLATCLGTSSGVTSTACSYFSIALTAVLACGPYSQQRIDPVSMGTFRKSKYRQ